MGTWREMSGRKLRELISMSISPVMVFFYTPTCGNCKVARRVLDSVLSDLDPAVTIIACNLNLMPQAAVDWQIERIPALLMLRAGQMVRKTYDFSSLEELSAFCTRP